MQMEQITVRKLMPTNPDNWLTNGETYSRMVYLGKGDDPYNWREITDEEYKRIQAAQAEPPAELEP